MSSVRVVIPTYQRASLVAEAIASVQAQTFRDCDIVVADDGSEDNTSDVVERLAAQDPRIQYVRLAHQGVAAARNAAIEQPGVFSYVAFLDSDDMWLPHHLERAVAALEAHREVALFFARAETLDPAGLMTAERMKVRRDSDRKPLQDAVRIDDDLYELAANTLLGAIVRAEFGPLTPTVVIRASAISGHWFDAGLVMMEDSDLYLRLAASGRPIAYSDAVHAHVRLQGDNMTLAHDLSSPRVRLKCQSWVQFALRKRQHCASDADRRSVRWQIGVAAYLTGQCSAEQGLYSDARRAYLTALRHDPGRLALRGLLAASLPNVCRRTATWFRHLRHSRVAS
jgi:glycosyltransferase involved in cell wall biosynthesis